MGRTTQDTSKTQSYSIISCHTYTLSVISKPKKVIIKFYGYLLYLFSLFLWSVVTFPLVALDKISRQYQIALFQLVKQALNSITERSLCSYFEFSEDERSSLLQRCKPNSPVTGD